MRRQRAHVADVAMMCCMELVLVYILYHTQIIVAVCLISLLESQTIKYSITYKVDNVALF